MNIVLEKKMSIGMVLLLGIIVSYSGGNLLGKIIALISLLLIGGLSIALHELGHVWGYRKVGYKIEKIELGLGGGSVKPDIDSLDRQIKPNDIIIITLPALLVTLFLTIVLYTVYMFVENPLIHNIIKASLGIHVCLLLFNSYPFFTLLDGGNLYFSILWKIMGPEEDYYTFLPRFSKVQLYTSYMLAFAAAIVITFYRDNALLNVLSLMVIFLAILEFKYIKHLIEIGEIQYEN